MIPNSIFVERVNEIVHFLSAVLTYCIVVLEQQHIILESHRKQCVMGCALWLASDDDTHIVGVKAELPQNKILRDRKVFAITTLLQKLCQCLPFIAGSRRQANAIVCVLLCIDIAIHESNLFSRLELSTLHQHVPKTSEPRRTGLLVKQALLNGLALGLVSFKGVTPCGPVGSGREEVFGSLE